MTLSDIGYDFQKIKSATFMRKNRTLAMVALIIAPTFLIIFAAFMILYLLKVPMEINGFTRQFSDREYQSFFQIFLGINASVIFIMLILFVVSIKMKPKPYLYYTTDVDGDPILYALDRKSITYIDQHQLIRLDLKSKQVGKTDSKSEIYARQNALLFWKKLEGATKFRVKQGMKKIKIIVIDTVGNRTQRLVYRLYFDDSGILRHYQETIMNYQYGKQNLQAFYTYTLENVNQFQRIPYHPAIQKELWQTE